MSGGYRNGLVAVAVVACLAMSIAGCARRERAAAPEKAPAAEPAAKGTPPPADSPLAKVKPGMRPEEVVAALGAPSRQSAYPTGKAFAPFYYGPDRWRSVYYYKGKGRVVFKGDGGFSSGSQVLYLEYDPTEPG
jgi:hypothetical protein